MSSTTPDAFCAAITWNDQGLVPVIVQSVESKEILMMAWMNAEGLRKTIETQTMWYFSRSRQKLWQKGERSQQTQAVKELWLDCDGDTLLAKVQQTGVACHTGRMSCFFQRYDQTKKTWENAAPVIVSPDTLYGE